MDTVWIDLHITHGPHLPAVRKLGPAIDSPVRIWVGLPVEDWKRNEEK